VLCYDEGDRHECRIDAFDDDTLARIALLPDREKYLFHISDISDATFESIRRAPFARHLRVAYGKLASLTALSAVPELRTLVLDHVEVHDLAPIASLTKLQELELDDIGAGTDFSAVSQLGALESLSILRTGITKLPDPKAWTSLTELHLEGNQKLTSFGEIAPLKKLRVLHLGSSKITSLAPVSGMSALEELGIELTPLHTMKALHGLKSLKHVLVSPDMPLFERAALKKAVPGVEVEAYGPKSDGYIVKEKGKCYAVYPGCCLCAEETLPCPATK
jgi:Leucine-rich repeat (LRR) protein